MARRTEPLQAVVNPSGNVTDVIVCDQATADLFTQYGVFDPSTMHDCTGLAVGMGYTWAADRTPAFRPPQPTPESTWNETTQQWDVPPNPNPTGNPEQPASAEEPASASSEG